MMMMPFLFLVCLIFAYECKGVVIIKADIHDKERNFELVWIMILGLGWLILLIIL